MAGAGDPGVVIGIGRGRRVGYECEPLHDAQYESIRDHIQAQRGEAIGPKLEESAGIHVGTWEYWMLKAVQSGFGEPAVLLAAVCCFRRAGHSNTRRRRRRSPGERQRSEPAGPLRWKPGGGVASGRGRCRWYRRRSRGSDCA